MNKFNRFFILLSLVLALGLLGACSKEGMLDDFAAAGESPKYFKPLLDIYVVRGGTQGFVLPAGETSADVFLRKAFAYGPDSVNPGLTQAGLAYYENTIRVFYISGAGLKTFLDCKGLLTPPYPTDDEIKEACMEENFYYLANKTSFSIVDESGTPTGESVVVDMNRQRTFFLKFSVLEGVAGLSTVGYPSCWDNATCKKEMTVLIFSSPTDGATYYYGDLKRMSEVVIHEFGHYYGLFHNFDQQSGVNLSCKYAPQGSTNRYMDYTYNPEVFIPCEAMITQYNASLLLGEKALFSRNSAPYDTQLAEKVKFTVNYVDRPHETLWKSE